MRRSFISLVVIALLMFGFVVPRTSVQAQEITLPAEINKSFTPTSMAAGETSVLKVTVFNPNGDPLTNTAWTDNLVAVQPGLVIANPADVTNSCGGTVTAAPGSTTLSLSGGTVPAKVGSINGSCTVSIRVTSFTTGALINLIPANTLSATVLGRTISNTSEARATLAVTGTPQPAVTKSFSPGTIWAGATSRLSIRIQNPLPSTTLTQASLTDNLPPDVFLANPVSPTLTACGSSATLSAVSGGTSVTLTNATIAPSSTCTVTVSVTSNKQKAYDNTISAGALNTQQGLTNPTPATSRLNVQEIGLTKQFDTTRLGVGDTTTLTITLQNPKSTPYTGVKVTDTLPSALEVAGTATTTCGGTVTTTANSVSLTGGTIPAGTTTNPGACTISVLVRVRPGTSPGTFTNRIPPAALSTDQGIGNLRAATASVTVLGTDLAAIKSFSPATITAGGNSRLRITINAPSDVGLTNLTITDNLPPGITISNSTAPRIAGCATQPAPVLTAPTGGTTITLAGASIPVAGQCTIDVWVTGNINGSYTNSIPPTNITNNENRQLTNTITSTLNVQGPNQLAIQLVKGFDPLLVTGGATSTLSIQLINPGLTPLTGIAFTDTMPVEMLLADPVNFNVGTCGGTLTGTPGTNSFSFSGGSLPPLAKCTLTLSATMTVNGNRTNTIPAGAIKTDQNASNPDPVQASLTNLPGVSIAKKFTPNQIVAGASSQLTITIKNTGNIELVEMAMTDNLPAGIQIAGGSAPAPTNTCGGTLTATPGTQVISLTNGNLAGNLTCNIVVSITGSKAGDYTNTIPVGGLRPKGAQNNEPASDTLKITGPEVKPTSTPKTPQENHAFLIPITGFKAGVVTDLSHIAKETYVATSDVTLEIPSLGVKIPVVGVPKRDGTWNVAWLDDQAGWLEGSAFPSWNGNSVLTGHVYLASGLPGPFINLNTMKFGDKIIVHAYGQKYVFEVQSNNVVAPNDRSVIKHEEKPWLTLVTCKDYDEKTQTYINRVVVRAILVEVQWDK